MNEAARRQLLPETVHIARLAGEAVMRVYRAGFTVSRKDDNSPVTAADTAAHGIILHAMQSLTPHIPLLSEEGPLPSWQKRQSWETYWLVDPLDGTREFIRRNNQFTVNIALIHAGCPALGVVLAPATDTVWYGGPGLGAYREKAGGNPEPIHTAAFTEPPLQVVMGRAKPGPRSKVLLDKLPEHRIQVCGASLKLCLIAEGSADLFPRFGRISEWDLGAPQAILEAAGGSVRHIRNFSPLRYNARPSLTTADIIAFGDTSVDWQRYFQ